MSRIRGRNTKPELMLRRELWSRGLRYRISPKLIGKPDIVFVSSGVAVFVDGCFWHGCPDHCREPKTNAQFWREKIAKNRSRDTQVNLELSENGWHVLRFWEHQIKQDLVGCADAIQSAIDV